MKQKVTVLMSTYNGEKYLKEQIDSVLNQKNVDINLLIRDDGSTDNTINILKEYGDKIKWYKGSNVGPAMSFFDLMKNAPKTDYYSFCDQDDVWLEDKISIAIEKIKSISNKSLILYYGMPTLADKNLTILNKKTNKKNIMHTFPNSIISSSAIGCTMVFTKELLDLIVKKQPTDIYMHDAWVHKVCLLFDGELIYDDNVHMLYRQHEQNVIGGSNTYAKKIKRVLKSLNNKKCLGSKIVLSLYECYCNEMPNYYKKLVLIVCNYKKNFTSRMKLLFNRKIKTDYFLKNIVFKISVILGSF